jgi:hypothetical protein
MWHAVPVHTTQEAVQVLGGVQHLDQGVRPGPQRLDPGAQGGAVSGVRGAAPVGAPHDLLVHRPPSGTRR